ncbi:hypothetical protein [Kluyvera intermedia]|uniref:hypothetical protein n=1 Tax=Kluyvera intermedia TaxID=61648 RepID=UPI00372D5593
MSITNIFANLLDSSKASLLGKVRALEFGVRRLENRTKVYVYIDVSSIGLTAATATCRSIKNNLNLNSKLVLAVSGGNYPNLDTPPRADSGTGTQSGTIVFEANQLSPNRFTCWFYNENGNWYRYFNDAYPTTDARYDSGWIWAKSCGMQQQISTNDLTSKYSGKLSNIREPGEYFLAGSTVNAATDSPYGSTGSPAIKLTVERMQLDRGIIQTIRDNISGQTGFRQSITSAGVIGGFVQEHTSTVDILTQHVVPKTPSTYNVAGSSSRYVSIYLTSQPNVSSDIRIKTDMRSIDQRLIDFVMQTEIHEYRLISGGTARYGILITKELFESVREFTDGILEQGEDGMYSCYYAEWQNILLEGLRRKVITL